MRVAFVHCRASPRQIDDYFGVLDSDEVLIRVDDSWRIEHCLVFVGAFPSVKAARDCGYNRPMPRGLCEHKSQVLPAHFWTYIPLRYEA